MIKCARWLDGTRLAVQCRGRNRVICTFLLHFQSGLYGWVTGRYR